MRIVSTFPTSDVCFRLVAERLDVRATSLNEAVVEERRPDVVR